MHKGTVPALLLTTSVLSALLALACGGDDDTGPGGETITYNFAVNSELVASGGLADGVSVIEFSPDGRIFYGEQYKGTVRILNADGTAQTEPFVQVPVADWLGLDWGLTGMALDPAFETNHYVYLFYTTLVGNETFQQADGTTQEYPIGKPVIVRYTEQNGAATEETVISDAFPPTDVRHPGYNANGEIHFGPDGLLYASVGGYDLFGDQPDLIRDPASPIGKLLRMNPDGSPAGAEGLPEGADGRVFASGFREPFSFTFGPDGTIYGNDNTTVTCEELNVLKAGGDYGWPEMGDFPFSDCGIGPGEQPIFHFTREGLAPGEFKSFVEVSAMQFLTGSIYDQLSDGLLVCESQVSKDQNEVVTRGILRRLTMISPTEVASSEVIVNDCKGAVAVRDGEVFYSNGNEIRRLVQSSGETQEVPQAPSP